MTLRSSGHIWRAATSDDDEAIVSMCLALNREDPGQDRVSEAQVRRTLSTLREAPARGRAVVLELAGKPSGYAFLIGYWSNEIGGELCCLDEIYVAPEARSQGHGTALIEALAREEGPWPRGAVAITLEVTPQNLRALRFYERIGFRAGNQALRLRVQGK
jgi:ribosomal protein S18 acetylase RimI-like enzyme